MAAKTLTYRYLEDGPVRVSTEAANFTPHTWQPRGRVEEIPDINFFCSLVRAAPKDSLVLDVGAQTGLYTLSARFYNHVHFHAFEPLPQSAKYLQQNLDLNNVKNATVHNTGLGTVIGTTKLRVPEHKGLCTMGNNPQRFGSHEEVEVDVTTIDEMFPEDNVSVIKIDTEGWEYYVLKGGAETIKRCKPGILMEWNEVNMAQCGVTIEMMEDLMTDLNYRPSIVYEENVYIIPNDSKKNGNDSSGDNGGGSATGPESN